MSNFARKSATAKPSPALKAAPKRDSHWDSATETNLSTRKPKNIASFSKRVGKKELVNLTSQMAIMAKSGVDVASALQSIVRQCAHPTLKMVLEDVHENVLGGNSVSESLAQYPAIFNETFVASVAAGE